MLCSLEALGVYFVNVLGAGRACREPAMLGHHLQPADGSPVARRLGKDSLDPLARQFGDFDLLR